jgi:hypothetical protein
VPRLRGPSTTHGAWHCSPPGCSDRTRRPPLLWRRRSWPRCCSSASAAAKAGWRRSSATTPRQLLSACAGSVRYPADRRRSRRRSLAAAIAWGTVPMPAPPTEETARRSASVQGHRQWGAYRDASAPCSQHVIRPPQAGRRQTPFRPAISHAECPARSRYRGGGAAQHQPLVASTGSALGDSPGRPRAAPPS